MDTFTSILPIEGVDKAVEVDTVAETAVVVAVIIVGSVEEVETAVEENRGAETVVLVGDAEDVGEDTGTIFLNRKPLTMVEVGLEAEGAAVGCAAIAKDVVGAVVGGVVSETVGDAVVAGADAAPGI